jgi:hypothetical protein
VGGEGSNRLRGEATGVRELRHGDDDEGDFTGRLGVALVSFVPGATSFVEVPISFVEVPMSFVPAPMSFVEVPMSFVPAP